MLPFTRLSRAMSLRQQRVFGCDSVDSFMICMLLTVPYHNMLYRFPPHMLSLSGLNYTPIRQLPLILRKKHPQLGVQLKPFNGRKCQSFWNLSEMLGLLQAALRMKMSIEWYLPKYGLFVDNHPAFSLFHGVLGWFPYAQRLRIELARLRLRANINVLFLLFDSVRRNSLDL